MKTIQATIFLIVLLFSCSKSSDENASSESINGNWKLTETLVDPGDGSGKWKPVDSANLYIQFNTDGTVDNNLINGAGISVYSTVANYILTSDSTINLIDSTGNIFPRHFTIQENTLTIMGGCYEACGSRYVKGLIN